MEYRESALSERTGHYCSFPHAQVRRGDCRNTIHTVNKELDFFSFRRTRSKNQNSPFLWRGFSIMCPQAMGLYLTASLIAMTLKSFGERGGSLECRGFQQC